MKTQYKILLYLFLLCKFSYSFADHECSMYLIQVTCYSTNGNTTKVYMYSNPYIGYCYTDSNMIYNPFNRMAFINNTNTDNPITSTNQFDFSKIKGIDTTKLDNIICINKSLLINKDITIADFYISNTQPYTITDKIYELNYLDTLHYNRYFIGTPYIEQEEYSETEIPKKYQLLDSSKIYGPLICHYSITKNIDMDSIYAITLDTIIWCEDYEQLQQVTDADIQIFTTKKIVFHYRWEVSDCGDYGYWIDFVSFDPKWTKSKFASLLNHEKLIKPFGTDQYNPISLLPPSIQTAIKAKKIYAFIRWSP